MAALVAPNPADDHVDDEPVEAHRQLLNASGVELPDTAEQRWQALPHPSLSNVKGFERRERRKGGGRSRNRG